MADWVIRKVPSTFCEDTTFIGICHDMKDLLNLITLSIKLSQGK